MSMKIDQEKIDSGDLTFLEAKYLKDRMLLPDDYEMPEDPNDGEDEESQPLPTRVTPLEDQDVPTFGNRGGIVLEDDEEEDYDAGWNNDQRRGELSERGLSVEGAKADLIARLRRSDIGELEDGDENELED